MLTQNDGQYKGRLNLAWAYGVVFTRITRQQLKALTGNNENAVEKIFPSAQTICQDEMTQSVLPEVFRQKIAGMFTTGFRTRVTPRMRDILRAHLFPEVTVKQNSQIKIMDIQQEILARNIGDGHRVIHGVAGSGKTMILLFRCLYLAETTSGSYAAPVQLPGGRFHTGYCRSPPSHCGSIRSERPIASADR